MLVYKRLIRLLTLFQFNLDPKHDMIIGYASEIINSDLFFWNSIGLVDTVDARLFLHFDPTAIYLFTTLY